LLDASFWHQADMRTALGDVWFREKDIQADIRDFRF